MSETLVRCSVNGCDTQLILRHATTTGYGDSLRCSSCRNEEAQGRPQAHRFTHRPHVNPKGT